jgi:hypothetical protein
MKSPDIAEVLYEAVKDRIPDKATFVKALENWDLIPLEMDGRLIGGVMQKGPEIHVGYKEPPKASIRSHLKRVLKEVITNYGFAETSVMMDNKRGLRFCHRLGFVATDYAAGVIYMKCDRCNYV